MIAIYHPEAEDEMIVAARYYENEASGFRILAVMNLHRYPNYWKNRI
jgi:hypothetical protein